MALLTLISALGFSQREEALFFLFMKFDILTLFPEMFDAYVNESILKRGQEQKLIQINLHDWRDFSNDKHNTVDDKPYGGGAGMLLKVDPIYKQLQAIEAINHDDSTRVIMMSPDGKQFTQEDAKRLAQYDRVVLLCGRYEGFDARVEEFIDEKISIGPYVLAGGELPAMVVTEAVARNIPSVLGHDEALKDETFAHGDEYGEYPQYTRPEVFATDEGQELSVPEILLSGDHGKIDEWKKENKRPLQK